MRKKVKTTHTPSLVFLLPPVGVMHAAALVKKLEGLVVVEGVDATLGSR